MKYKNFDEGGAASIVSLILSIIFGRFNFQSDRLLKFLDFFRSTIFKGNIFLLCLSIKLQPDVRRY